MVGGALSWKVCTQYISSLFYMGILSAICLGGKNTGALIYRDVYSVPARLSVSWSILVLGSG